MEEGMAELSQKIDQLAAQVACLTEQAQLAQRQRSELLQDLLAAGSDGDGAAGAEFGGLEQYALPADLVRLLKRVVRDGPIFERLLEQLESVTELADTVMPLAGPAFEQATTAMDALDRRGYFVFARGGLRVVDNVVTSFGEEDVRQLGDNVVLILRTLKELTQPEILNLAHNLVQVIEQEKITPADTSLMALWREMRDPNVRRGLALTLRVLRALGAQTSRPAGGVQGKNGAADGNA